MAADEATTRYRPTRARLADLTAADPALAASFHRLAARQLARRTAHLTRLVEALQRRSAAVGQRLAAASAT